MFLLWGPILGYGFVVEQPVWNLLDCGFLGDPEDGELFEVEVAHEYEG